MTAKRVGVIGSGVVGETLAHGFLAKGWEVMRGSREPAKLAAWRGGAGPAASTGTFAEAARFGQVVVLAVKGTAAEEALAQCGDEPLAGKTVIDATNPIADAPPQDGVLSFFTRGDESLLERLQRLAPRAELVKAFSCVGHAQMVDPDFGGERPTMFICGDSARAKREVEAILAQFGWEWADMGGATSARAIEPLCVLWCLRGFKGDGWDHAFKLLVKGTPA